MKWEVIGSPRTPDKKQVDETVWLQTCTTKPFTRKLRTLRGSRKPRGRCCPPQQTSSRLWDPRSVPRFLGCLALACPFFIPSSDFWMGVSVTGFLCLSYLHIWEKRTGSRLTGGGDCASGAIHRSSLKPGLDDLFKWDLGFLSEIQIRYCIWSWCCNGLRFLSTSAWDDFWGWMGIFEAAVNCGEQCPHPRPLKSLCSNLQTRVFCRCHYIKHFEWDYPGLSM